MEGSPYLPVNRNPSYCPGSGEFSRLGPVLMSLHHVSIHAPTTPPPFPGSLSGSHLRSSQDLNTVALSNSCDCEVFMGPAIVCVGVRFSVSAGVASRVLGGVGGGWGRGQWWGCGVVTDSCPGGLPLDSIVRLFVLCVCVYVLFVCLWCVCVLTPTPPCW